MDEQMIEDIARIIDPNAFTVHKSPFDGQFVTALENCREAARVKARAAHSVMAARVAELEEALKPFADQMTTAELLHNPDRSELTPEHRIERMGERKRERDANILRARTALAPHPKADE